MKAGLLVALVVTLASAVACGDEEVVFTPTPATTPAPEVTPTPPQNATATPEPAATQAPAPTPTLGPPEVSQPMRILGQGSLRLEIAPGQRQFIQPLQLAQAFGSPPPCAGFAFVFRWRVDGGASVRFEGELRGARVEIAEGPEGNATAGCIVIEAINDGDVPITGDMRYYVASFQ